MKVYAYTMHHLPTGKKFIHYGKFLSQRHYFAVLNFFNLATDYKYTVLDPNTEIPENAKILDHTHLLRSFV